MKATTFKKFHLIVYSSWIRMISDITWFFLIWIWNQIEDNKQKGVFWYIHWVSTFSVMKYKESSFVSSQTITLTKISFKKTLIKFIEKNINIFYVKEEYYKNIFHNVSNQANFEVLLFSINLIKVAIFWLSIKQNSLYFRTEIV